MRPRGREVLWSLTVEPLIQNRAEHGAGVSRGAVFGRGRGSLCECVHEEGLRYRRALQVES